MVVGYAPSLLKKWLVGERRFRSEIIFSVCQKLRKDRTTHDLVVKFAVTYMRFQDIFLAS